MTAARFMAGVIVAGDPSKADYRICEREYRAAFRAWHGVQYPEAALWKPMRRAKTVWLRRRGNLSDTAKSARMNASTPALFLGSQSRAGGADR